MAQSNTDFSFVHKVRNCFSISTLVEWQDDPAHKGCVQAIGKRIDLLMTMDLRAAHRAQCTAEQLEELERFERQRRPEFQAARTEKIRTAAAAARAEHGT